MGSIQTINDEAEIKTDEEECSICAKNPPFNATTLAALEEGNAMFEGKIPCKWYHSLEEAREDLGV
jgi:hypothetical protein